MCVCVRSLLIASTLIPCIIIFLANVIMDLMVGEVTPLLIIYFDFPFFSVLILLLI